MLNKNSCTFRFAILLLVMSIVISVIPICSAAADSNTSQDKVATVSESTAVYDPDPILTAGKDDTYRHLTWKSGVEGTEYVKWVEADKLTDGSFPTQCYSSAATKANGVCRAQITDLKTNTDYAYVVGGENTGWSEIFYISANDMDDKSFSFLLFGDPQILTNVDGQNWNISLEKAKEWFGDDIEFILSVGDQTNAGYDVGEFSEFIAPDQLRTLPLVTIVGNHDDRAPVYSQYFTYTDVDQETVTGAGTMGGDYWVEYDGVLIITLNYAKKSKALHRAFMEKAIAEYTELYGEPVWTMVAFHDSKFSAANSRYLDHSESRDEYSAMLSELGVDAVMMGHDHIYTRTYMINGTEILDDASLYNQVGDDKYGSITDPPEGSVLYVTANSGSGSKFYEMTSKPVPFAACSNQENVPNLTKVDVTSDSLQFTTYRCSANNEIGDVVDFFAIHRTNEDGADNYAPTLNVPHETRYYPGEEVDLTAGISAYDNCDGDITDKITVSGTVNTSITSIITYTVTDQAGNTTTVERKLIPIEADAVISTEETTWKYLDDGTYPFEFNGEQYEWTTDSFDDSGWKEGKGAFGSINGELGDHNGVTPNTLINLYFPEGSDEEGTVIPNYFFRTTFDVKDPETVNWIEANLYFDDAVNIYINGVMVESINCFTGGSNFGYSGNERDDPLSRRSTFINFSLTDQNQIDALNLKSEGNVLAIEIFQGSFESDDIFFDFESLYIGHTLEKLPFEDVKTESWYYNSVSKAYSKGLFAGVTETTFEPKSTMTRAMTWTVLARIKDADLSGGEKWYSAAQSWVVKNGFSDGTYPHDNVTREQLATMLYSINGKPDTSGSLDSFTDKDTASAWAVKALVWAVSEELMAGRGNGILAPRADMTRAEACTLLIKYLDN